MHATSTIEQVPAPPAVSDSRTFKRAIRDLRQGYANRELWSHLGWQDIKQRYRRSVLGPFWITISQGVIALGLGVLYAVLFGAPVATFLPYVATGLIVWTFISGCLTEGMECFIANEGLIKQLPSPLSVYALRTVWRQMLMFAHNIIVYVIIMLIYVATLTGPYTLTGDGTCGGANAAWTCHPGIGLDILLAIPGFVMVALNAGWVTMLLGIISTRFRDIPQVINALVQLLFYLTPIVWPLDQVSAVGGNRHQLAETVLPIIQLNPIYHLVQVVRAPLLGQHLSIYSWLAVAGMAIVGWGLALVAMRNYRARVSYWV
ncbi:ABC transporter permease [Amycolatopsis albispora]|uniref:Sugar ABC transporter permease n=1 Tax=Amycolatopsis albispora TaxID=1804986 RepID=A0A344LCT6_9PSEU|nr:ABC transporter permease [Amycolatopsis albispora]AXB45860.1 sugar ABC transporter permease [Amycolatopsis albispora]